MSSPIQIRVHYTVIILEADDAAKEFHTWYNNVFSLQNPAAAEDFAVEFGNGDDGPYLEVLQHNPTLSAEALLTLFEASRFETTPVKKPLPDNYN